MANRANKGASFERWFCTELSLWWSEQSRTDIFWRTSTSGARATSRRRKGQKTANQHGDICALDPVGQPLIDVLTIELKRGYNRASIQDLVDKPMFAAKQTYEQWMDQAVEAYLAAGSLSWMLVIRRDRREPVVIMPTWIAQDIGISKLPLTLWVLGEWTLGMLLLSDFFNMAKPHRIIALSKEN